MATINHKTKSVIAIVIAAVILLGVGAGIVLAINALRGNPQPGPTLTINKSFNSIGRTKDGRQVTDGSVPANLPIKLTTAQITDNVYVNGQKATARNGKLLLVINLEIENKYQASLFSKPYNLMRLVRSDGKRIAPSVYQGDVEVLPISVKKSNLAFVIEPNEKNFTVEVGEINGKKEAIQINF